MCLKPAGYRSNVQPVCRDGDGEVFELAFLSGNCKTVEFDKCQAGEQSGALVAVGEQVIAYDTADKRRGLFEHGLIELLAKNNLVLRSDCCLESSKVTKAFPATITTQYQCVEL